MAAEIEGREELILDGSKLAWHQDRLEKWRKGERFAPITIDMALTRACNYRCYFCFAELQTNKSFPLKEQHMRDFIDDCAEMGVRAISLVSDGESTISPIYAFTIQYGRSKGIDMASGTNAYLLKEAKLREVLPHLTYLRVNFSGGERDRYASIMGVKPEWFDQVCDNIKTMMRLKKENGWDCTVGMQMVLDQRCEDQIIPLAKLAIELAPDYLVIKHTSDDHKGTLGVDYSKYAAMENDLVAAEAMSNEQTKIRVKWRKIRDGKVRPYQRCHGTAFHLQLSGSGLVAPCGPLFGEDYKKYHIGNITQKRFKDIVNSDEYWNMMKLLASDEFNAQKMCSTLCLQDTHNIMLDRERRLGQKIEHPGNDLPAHGNFI